MINLLNFSIGLLLSAGPLAQADSTAVPAPFQQAQQDIKNFRWLQDGSVFRGGRPSDEGIRDLAQLGVSAVIDLQGGDLHTKKFYVNIFNSIAEPGEHPKAIRNEEANVRAAGMAFYNFPLDADDKVTEAEGQAIDEVIKLMHHYDNQPVYIHCQHGKDRTGLVMALYQIRYRGLSPQAAHDEMALYGHRGFFDLLFTGRLDDFFWAVAPRYQAEAVIDEAVAGH